MADSTDNCLEWMLSWCFWLLSCHWKCGESRIKSGNETRFLKALQDTSVILSILFSSWFWQDCSACSPQSDFPDLLHSHPSWPVNSFQLVCGRTSWGQRNNGTQGGITAAGGWQMQSLGGKHKSLVAHPLDLSATILQKVRNTWIIYLL